MQAMTAYPLSPSGKDRLKSSLLLSQEMPETAARVLIYSLVLPSFVWVAGKTVPATHPDKAGA
ncbi:hypothetical protein COS16_10135, partial [Candidatus Desantisbacteria bacterium CG02_land_8_20_14_3_00_49_13]